MARRSEFVGYVCDLLAPLGEIRAKAMFGGWGLYCGDLFFAIIADDTLYLKADANSREHFTSAGQRPFTFVMRGAQKQMDYYTAPADALEESETLCEWARLALAAARRNANSRARSAQE